MIVTRRNFINNAVKAAAFTLVSSKPKLVKAQNLSPNNIQEICSKYAAIYKPTYISSGSIVAPSNRSFGSGGTFFRYAGETYTVLHVTIDGRTIVGPSAPDAAYKDWHHFSGYELTLETNDRPVIIRENGEVLGERLKFARSSVTEYAAILTASSVIPIQILSVATNSILFKHLGNQRTRAGNSGSPIVTLNGELIGVHSTVLPGSRCEPLNPYEQTICLKDPKGRLLELAAVEGQAKQIWDELGLGVFGGMARVAE